MITIDEQTKRLKEIFIGLGYTVELASWNVNSKEIEIHFDSSKDTINKLALLAGNTFLLDILNWKAFGLLLSRFEGPFLHYTSNFEEAKKDEEILLKILEANKKRKLQSFSYPEDMDSDCVQLCDLFNSLGLTTKYSCCGHNEQNFCIMFQDEINEAFIKEFLQHISLHKEYTPLVGGLKYWLRKVDGKIKGNWEYVASTISEANIDATTIRECFFEG